MSSNSAWVFGNKLGCLQTKKWSFPKINFYLCLFSYYFCSQSRELNPRMIGLTWADNRSTTAPRVSIFITGDDKSLLFQHLKHFITFVGWGIFLRLPQIFPPSPTWGKNFSPTSSLMSDLFLFRESGWGDILISLKSFRCPTFLVTLSQLIPPPPWPTQLPARGIS